MKKLLITVLEMLLDKLSISYEDYHPLLPTFGITDNLIRSEGDIVFSVDGHYPGWGIVLEESSNLYTIVSINGIPRRIRNIHLWSIGGLTKLLWSRDRNTGLSYDESVVFKGYFRLRSKSKE